VGVEQTSGETERERECEMEHCQERVAALVINLTIGQVFMIARERIIRDLIKMNIEIMPSI
jgi:hypothetical protein